MNNRLLDANNLYQGGVDAVKGSSFKYRTQLYEMNMLLETALLQKDLKDGTYKPEKARKFLINERGHERYISSDIMRDKAVAHTLCDVIITPGTSKYLIYDNTASQKKKGVSFHRKRLEVHLHQYFNEYHTNHGWILLIDFSGYYPNLNHDMNLRTMMSLIEKSRLFNEEEISMTRDTIRKTYQKMEMDVSRFSDEEIRHMYDIKVDPMLNAHVNRKQLTGEKMLHKGVDIGNQVSQNAGIIHPYRIDNYCKTVKGCHYYGRYTDDTRIIHSDKKFLEDLLEDIRVMAKDEGLIINEKKTRIQPLTKPFRHLQIKYALTDTGKVIKRISPKGMTRERHKLKAYRRKLDANEICYSEIENSFKSWLCNYWHVMTWRQIYNITLLFIQLFGRKPKWKKGYSRLNWLMVHPSPTWI